MKGVFPSNYTEVNRTMSNETNATDTNEFSQKMLYHGASKGAEIPTTGYIASTHYHVTEKGRKDQLEAIGLSTREEHVDADVRCDNAAKQIKAAKAKRLCLLFAAMFVLSIFIGLLVAVFYQYSLLMGFAISAACGFVLFVVPMIYFLITSIRNKTK